jgi:hypothetical protein
MVIVNAGSGSNVVIINAGGSMNAEQLQQLKDVVLGIKVGLAQESGEISTNVQTVIEALSQPNPDLAQVISDLSGVQSGLAALSELVKLPTTPVAPTDPDVVVEGPTA